MSTTPNAYGNALGTAPPFLQYSAVGTPHGTFVKPGGRVAAFVRSTGAQDLDDLFVRDNLVLTLNEACKRCRSGLNDVIYVLPGHTENLAIADSVPDLVAGTQIVGMGRLGASNNPTFTWTATGSTLLLNVANVSLIGLNMNFAGVDAVVAPITVSAAGCSIAGNHITVAAGSAGATTPI